MATLLNYFGKTSIITAVLWTLIATRSWGFSDTANHWATTCIDRLQSSNLVSGYPDGRFQPNATITRAEFAVLMLNTFPQAEQKRSAISFTDVPQTHWAYSAIQDAYQREFFTGYPDRTFKPSQPIPRVQAIAILANTLNFPTPEAIEPALSRYFDDANDIPNYAKPAIAKATNGRLIVNYPRRRQLKPNERATRGEIAALLCQSLNFKRTIPAQYVTGGNQDWAIPPEWGGISDFSEGLAVAKINGKYGYMDKMGTLVIEAKFENAMPLSDGLAAVKIGEKWGYIDKAGTLVIPAKFDQITDSFSEGLAGVGLLESWGYIDKTGTVVISGFHSPARSYERAVTPFSEGLAMVRRGEMAGYIDKIGQFVIPPQFPNATAVVEGLARVNVGGKWQEVVGGYDSSASPVLETQFQDNGIWGYIRLPD